MRQTWKEFHQQNLDIIRQTFKKLGLSLIVDESENEKFSIKNISDIEIENWRLTKKKKSEPNESNEIDEITGCLKKNEDISENETIDEKQVKYDLMKTNDHSENDYSENENDQNDDQLKVLNEKI